MTDKRERDEVGESLVEVLGRIADEGSDDPELAELYREVYELAKGLEDNGQAWWPTS